MMLEQACVVPQEVLPPWQPPSLTNGLSTFSSDTARALSSVCRRWRRLLSNPVVWSDISVFARSVDNLHWVELCLRRSSHKESMVRIDQPTMSRHGEEGFGAQTVITRYRTKIIGLYLRIATASDCDVMNIEMTNLERLHLADGSFAGDNTPTPFSLANFPGLRILTLEGVRAPLLAKEFARITDLTLDNCASPIDLSAILTVAPIERLRLCRVSVTHGDAIDPLPNLKLLVIRGSPVSEILAALPALSTNTKVYVHDWMSLEYPLFAGFPVPYSIFGHGNPVHTVSISMRPPIMSAVLRTSNGGQAEIIAEVPLKARHDSVQPLIMAMLLKLPTPSVLGSAHSMDIDVDSSVAREMDEEIISRLLLAAPRIVQLFLRGPRMFHLICNALSSDRRHGRLLPDLASLNVNLHSDDSFLEDLPLLKDVVANRSAMWKIAFSGTQQQTASILRETDILAKHLQEQGIRVFLLTSSPLSM